MLPRIKFLRYRRDHHAIRAIAASHKARSISVFGSVARGEDRPESDIDLLVDCDPTASLFDLVHMRQELSDFLQVDVDLVDQGGLFPRDSHIREEALVL